MKKKEKLVLFAGLAVAAGVAIYTYRKLRARRVLREVADEGYETAHDVLYPNAGRGSRKTHYGPVLPS